MKGRSSLSLIFCFSCSDPVGLIFSYTSNLKTSKTSESVEMSTPDVLLSPQGPSLWGLTERVLARGICNMVRQGDSAAKRHHRK